MTTCECVALDALPYDADDLRDGYRPPIRGQPAVADVYHGRHGLDARQACQAHAEAAAAEELLVDWYESTSSLIYRGRAHTIRDGRVYDGDGRELSRTELTHAASPNSRLWRWLTEHGIQRIATSGPSGQHSADREALLVRLPRDLVARVRAVADERGVTVLAVVTEALEQATR